MGIWSSYPPTRRQVGVTIGLVMMGASMSAYGAYLSFANIAPQQARAKARSDLLRARLRKMLDSD